MRLRRERFNRPKTKAVAPIDPSKKYPQSSSSSAIVRQSETLQMSSGPLPDPETLGKYEKVYPGLAKCIVESFESEYRHRHEMEAISLKADISAMELAHADVKRGQHLGFSISIRRPFDWRRLGLFPARCRWFDHWCQRVDLRAGRIL